MYYSNPIHRIFFAFFTHFLFVVKKAIVVLVCLSLCSCALLIYPAMTSRVQSFPNPPYTNHRALSTGRTEHQRLRYPSTRFKVPPRVRSPTVLASVIPTAEPHYTNQYATPAVKKDVVPLNAAPLRGLTVHPNTPFACIKAKCLPGTVCSANPCSCGNVFSGHILRPCSVPGRFFLFISFLHLREKNGMMSNAYQVAPTRPANCAPCGAASADAKTTPVRTAANCLSLPTRAAASVHRTNQNGKRIHPKAPLLITPPSACYVRNVRSLSFCFRAATKEEEKAEVVATLLFVFVLRLFCCTISK